MFAVVAILSIIYFLNSYMILFVELLNFKVSKILIVKNCHSTLILLSFTNCFLRHQILFILLDCNLNKVQLFYRIL